MGPRLMPRMGSRSIWKFDHNRLPRPCALQHLSWLSGFIDLRVRAQQPFALVLFSHVLRLLSCFSWVFSHEELWEPARDVDDRKPLDK
jgi:hypothetical protein